MFTTSSLIMGITAHLGILIADWLKKGVQFGFFAVLLFCCMVIFFGCSDGKKTPNAAEISARFSAYARLKDKDPVRARGELYLAADLLHQGHPKSARWAELVYEMDTTGTLTLEGLLDFEKLQLELAMDKGASKEAIQTHQDVVSRDSRKDC